MLFGAVDRQPRVGEWDYIDLGVPVDAPGRLNSYAGMSGGGIWRVDISRGPEGKWGWISPPSLEGVVFYQTAEENGLV